MIEVQVTIQVADAWSTDEAEQRVRDVIDSEPGMHAKYLSWSYAHSPKADGLSEPVASSEERQT